MVVYLFRAPEATDVFACAVLFSSVVVKYCEYPLFPEVPELPEVPAEPEAPDPPVSPLSVPPKS